MLAKAWFLPELRRIRASHRATPCRLISFLTNRLFSTVRAGIAFEKAGFVFHATTLIWNQPSVQCHRKSKVKSHLSQAGRAASAPRSRNDLQRTAPWLRLHTVPLPKKLTGVVNLTVQ